MQLSFVSLRLLVDWLLLTAFRCNVKNLADQASRLDCQAILQDV